MNIAENSIMTLHNPFTEDYKFQWDSVEYDIKAGETKFLPGFLAKHAAKGMAHKIILSKGEDGIKELNNTELVEAEMAKLLGMATVPTETKQAKAEQIKQEIEAMNKIPSSHGFQNLNPEEPKLEELTVEKLKSLAKEKQIPLKKNITKSELVELLTPKNETVS